jgi:predicted nucleic acid-binding protein
MDVAFLDTNILLRHILEDHADHSPRASAAIIQLERGELRVFTTATVVFEAVFTLHRGYRHSPSSIREALLPLLELRSVALPGKRVVRRAFDLFVDRRISFADAYHAALIENLNIPRILTFDRDFDGIPGLERIEP